MAADADCHGKRHSGNGQQEQPYGLPGMHAVNLYVMANAMLHALLSNPAYKQSCLQSLKTLGTVSTCEVGKA